MRPVLLAALAAALLVVSATATAATTTVHSTDGVTLKVHGDGGTGKGAQLVITLHGGPGDTHDYLGPLPKALSGPKVRVLSYDQRGLGEATAPKNDDYSLAASVRDIEAIRTAFGAKRVVIVGHSYGGLLAQAYAAAHPDRLAGLTLLDPEPADAAADAAGNGPFDTRLKALQAAGKVPDPLPGPDGNSCAPAEEAQTPVYLFDPDETVPPWYAGSSACNVHVLITTLGKITPAVLKPIAAGLAKVTAPSLVLYGTGDPFGVTWARWPIARLKTAHPTVVEVPKAGHVPWIEQPATVYRAVRALIARAKP